MRVVAHGQFNLCPSEVCNPAGAPEPVEFHPYPEVPAEAVEAGHRIFSAAGLDVGGIEYLETPDGRRVFYDINANSNLRRPIAEAFGFDPFERVAGYLAEQLELVRQAA